MSSSPSAQITRDASGEIFLSPPESVPRLPRATMPTAAYRDGLKVNLEPAAQEELDRFSKSLKMDSYRDAFKCQIKRMALRVPAKDVRGIMQHPAIVKHVFRGIRLSPICSTPDGSSTHRLLVLDAESPETLPPTVQDFVSEKQLTTEPHIYTLNYASFTAEQVLKALLPENLPEGTPTAFTGTGHLAHMNLRHDYLPYRYVIGQVILDKNATIRTVVNKLDSIDAEFRVFDMELLAGEDECDVVVSESGCIFSFDFRRVYWNSRLHTEHARLIDQFEPHQVISDVMAGVGPFAIPAAKKQCWVLANDLNPASYESLETNRIRNRVEQYCFASCEDGREFIRNSIKTAWRQGFEGKVVRGGVQKSSARAAKKEDRERRKQGIPLPPAPEVVRAIEFLDAYRGAYRAFADQQELEAELAARKANEADNGCEWPTVHVHCFTKELERPFEDIIHRANSALGLEGHPAALQPPSKPTRSSQSSVEDGPVSIHFVRSVAPNKDMYCLSFRLSRAILFDLDPI